MQTVSPELADAIADAERAPAWRVIVDWNRDGDYDHDYSDISGMVQSVKLNRGCATFSPEELNLNTGYSSGELTLTLGGERAPGDLTAYQLFGGGPTVSPLWNMTTIGARIQVFVGFQTTSGYEEKPLFTGWIRETPVSRKSRTVSIVANDNLDLVNAQVTLPLWATGTSSPYATWWNNNANASRSIAMSWVWEEVLRQCGRLVAPPVRSDAKVHWTCSGALLPSVGHITDGWATGPYPVQPSFVPEFYAQAPFGYGTPRMSTFSTAYASTSARVIVPMNTNPGNTPWSVSFGVWVYTDPTDASGDVMSIMMYLENTNLADDVNQVDNRARAVMTVNADGTFASSGVSGQPASGSPTYNLASVSTKPALGWHYYSATIDFAATTITHTLSVDGVAKSTTITGGAGVLSFSAAGNGYPPTNRTNLVRMVTKLPTHHAQVWTRAVADGAVRLVNSSQLTVPVQDNGAPLVDMTRSLTELSWIPDTYQVSAWDTLKDTVGAEWGALWIDASGTVHIMQRAEVNNSAVASVGPDNPVYSDDVVGEITLTSRLDTKRNKITMPGRYRNAVEKIVWTNQNALDYRVTAGTSVVNIEYPLDSVMALVQKLTADDANGPTNDATIDVRTSHGTAIKAADFTTGASAGWAFNLWQDHDQRSFYLSVQASPTEDDYIGSYIGGNKPSLQVAGRTFSDVQVVTTTVADSVDIANWGTYTWNVEESDWRQTSASINALCQNMIVSLSEGTIGISDVDLPHDPSRELFDVVVLANEMGEHLGALTVQIMGINSTLDSNGFRDTLSLRLLFRPGVAMWDNTAAGWESAWSA